MLCQLILRVLLVQLQHIAIPADLGQNGRCTDAGTGGISLDHRLCRDLQARRGTVAVHQHEVGHDVQLFHGLLHAAHGGIEDVVAVDDLRPHEYDPVGQSFFLDLIEQGIPLFLGELFGIVDALHWVLRVQDAGRYADRAAQRAAACLVHTGEAAVLCPHSGVVFVQRSRDLLVRAALHSSSSSAKSTRSSRCGGRSSEMRPHLQARNSSTSMMAQRSVFTSPPRTSRPRLRPMASSSS